MLASSPSRQDWPPNGLVSLLDMINFEFFDAYRHIKRLLRHIVIAESVEPAALADKADTKFALETLRDANRPWGAMDVDDIRAAVMHAETALLRASMTNSMLALLLGAVVDRIEHEMRKEKFYRYPRDKADLLAKWTDDWSLVIQKFKSSEYDIREGVDCYASKHYTAAGFHFMRVAERALRALAMERGAYKGFKPIERVEWETLLQELKKHVGGEVQQIPEARRQEYKAFYEGTLGQLENYKHWWRHPLSHSRLDCTEPHARSLLEGVKAMMLEMSARTDENGTKIDWS